MPSIITHHVLSEEVFERLNKTNKKLVAPAIDVFHAFAQSHDYLYYYTFHKGARKIKDLGDVGHKKDTQAYLINMITNIKDMKLTKDGEALAYLYGSLCHYAMDSTCHPFIFYKTGAWNDDDPNTYKYRGGHTMMEKSLDAIYYEKRYKRPFKYCNINKEVIGNVSFNKPLCDLIDKTWKDTYNKNDMASKYLKGTRDAKIINTILIHDYLGIKRMLYKFVDFVTDHRYNFQYCTTHITNPNKELLNLEHKEWNNPVKKELKYTSSFEDLFNECVLKVLKIIEVAEMYFNDKVDIEYVKKYVPDLSYSNGLLLKDYKPMQYFEY